MRRTKISGRQCHRRACKLLTAAVTAAVAVPATHARADVTLTENSSTNWTITNDALTVVFSPSGEKLTSVKLGIGTAAGVNLLTSLDQEFAGTGFGTTGVTQVFNAVQTSSYVDVWTTVGSNSTTNPITYAFHYVLFDNDPTIHVYETLNHSSTDNPASVGQGQFLFRGNASLFPNIYQVDTGPNNLAATQVTVPSTNPGFAAATAGTAHTVQNVTYDLTGSGIAGDNGSNFFTKYDYSTYTQFYQADTMFGSQYAVSAVIPSMESLTGGPTKQELAQTDPAILNLEFLSDHYGIDAKGAAYPGYAYNPALGANTSRLFGAYAFRVSSTATESAAQINQDAIDAIPFYDSEYGTDSELIASGYVASNQRGGVQITAANSAGWSSNINNNTVVLSDPNKNMQESTTGNQYWTQLASDGTGSITGVIPGTYRMTLYELGQWGETRIDGVQVGQGTISAPQNVKFTPENFGTAAPIFTVGTPDRSANEFMNGHTATGADLREFYGAYDFWGEEQALGTPGKVVYYATAVGATPATNDPNKWIANQWQTFNPGMYDATDNKADNYLNTAPAYVRDAAHGGTGPGPAAYHGSPWEIHFTVTSPQLAQGQFVVLSVGSVSLMASLVVTLNGHSETWGFGNFAPNDPQVRSGDAGFYQWAAFQFPTSDLNAVGADDVFTFSPSAHSDGVMYDAIRMEITNTSADPAVTGWQDYTYINGSSSTAPVDTFGLAATNAFIPEPASIGLLAFGGLLLSRRAKK